MLAQLRQMLPELFSGISRAPGPIISGQEWLTCLPLRSGRERILEVGSIHLRLKTPVERKRIRKAEEELYNGLRFPIQRIALPVPLDLSEYLNGLKGHAGADANQDRARLLLDKANHVASLIHDRHLVQWRNLVVIPIDEERTAGERIQYVRSGLERLGLAVRELSGEEMVQVWYELLSPERAASDRIRPGDDDAFVDRICPQILDFGKGKSFRMGGKFCRLLLVRDYPRHVSHAQLAEIYRMDRRVVVVQHIHPTDSGDLQREISNSIGEMNARLSGPLNDYEREVLRARLRDAQRLLRKLAAENHSVLDFCLYLLIRANDLEELDEVTRHIGQRLAGKGLKAKPVQIWQHQEALQTCLPIVHDPLRAEARRNIPAASISATFPYSNAELSHGAGFVFGVNKDTGNISLVDPWTLMNPHCAFISTSGGGKTFNLNELLIQFWAKGIQIRQLDIEGDKGRLCQQLKGQRVRIAPHAHNYMNPMEVRRPPLDPTLFLGADAEEPANGLAATIQRQKIMFRLLVPDVSRVEMAAAETALLECYHGLRIDYENYHERIGRAASWPTWTDLLPLLAKRPETQNLWAVLHSWVHGALGGMFNRATNVNLDNQYVLLDIHDCMGDPEARAVVFFMAMTFLWDEVNRDWREQKILDIDELGILADSEDALQFVWKVCKSARRRQCRLQVATQDPADFLSGRNPAAAKYALGIINNCATKVLGYLEPKALEQVAQVVNLSEAELALITSMFGKPQEKLLIVGEQRAHVEIPASLEELRILDPKAYRDRTGRDAD